MKIATENLNRPTVVITATGALLLGAVTSIIKQTEKEGNFEQIVTKTDKDSDYKTSLMHLAQDEQVQKRLQNFDNWWENKDNQNWAKERGFFELCRKYTEMEPDDRFQSELIAYTKNLELYYQYHLVENPEEEYQYSTSGFMQKINPQISVSALPEIKQLEEYLARLEGIHKENARKFVISELKKIISKQKDGFDPISTMKKKVHSSLLEKIDKNPNFLLKGTPVFKDLYRINTQENTQKVENLLDAEILNSILTLKENYQRPPIPDTEEETLASKISKAPIK